MSIILEGIDMPKDGDRIYLLIEGDKCFNALDPIQTLAEAIQIPTPHGRLIDVDELLSHLSKDPLFDLVERYGVSGVIESRPTILEAEE